MPDAENQPGGFYGSSAGPGYTPAEIKRPMSTGPVSNPLNRYASYTYSWSLWWLSLEDYNRLMVVTDVEDALSWNPGYNSYVVAEDAGRYPDRRVPGILPVNYNIQSVNFTTVISPTKQTRSSNMIEGSMTIMEPYGVTFVDSLVAASFDGQNYNNYTTQPYLLQLDFHGYDDNGNPIPDSESIALRKRFPIKLLSCAIEVTGTAGSSYKIDFAPAGHMAHSPEKAGLPKDITVTASTVGEFFYNLEAALNGFYKIDAFVKNLAGFADSIRFDIDPAIAASSITYGKGVPLSSSNPASKNIDLSKMNFSIKAGTSLMSIIDRTMAQSQFLIDQLNDSEKIDLDKQTNIFTAYKTTVATVFTGIDSGGTPHPGAFDRKRNLLPVELTYCISQHPTWKSESPHAPLYADSTPYTVKEYNYLYTGQNIDVIDFKLNFDMTYYTASLGYTESVPATQTTSDTGQDVRDSFARDVGFNPSILLRNVPNISPLRYRYIVGDQNLTIGGGLINNSKAQLAGDVIKSLYSDINGDMISVDLKIIGDPSLIKQDDWLYVPSPSNAPVYNGWDRQGQAEFTNKYGHIRMDAGEVVVKVTVNSPIDIDTELTNEGLVYPQPGTNQSLFSGQYKVIMIENSFAGGKFEQKLQLVRYLNSSLIDGIGQQTQSQRPAPQESQSNQSESVPTNLTSGQVAVDYDSYRESDSE